MTRAQKGLTAVLTAVGSLALSVVVFTPWAGSSGTQTDLRIVPSCSSVWKSGATLPVDYQGCLDGSSNLVAVVQDSRGRVWYDDRMSAPLGGTIKEQ